MALLALFDRFVDGLVAIVRLVCIVLATALFVDRHRRDRRALRLRPRRLVDRGGAALSPDLGVVPRRRRLRAEREHVGFELLFNSLPPRLRRATAIFIGLLILGFGWITFRYGIVFVEDFGSDLMETIPFTNYWYYPAMPVSGFLIMVFAVKLILDAWRGVVEAPTSNIPTAE